MTATKQNMISLTPTFVKFENEGDSVSGKLVGSDMVDMRDGAVPKYLVVSNEGRFAFLGTTQIAETLNNVPLGTYIHVEYLGKVKSGNGFMVKQFGIWEVAEGGEVSHETA